MKKFQFSLESVSRYKEQLVVAAQSELARVNKAVEQMTEKERMLQERYQDNKDKLNQAVSKGISPQMIWQYNRYGESLDKEMALILRKKQVLLNEKNRSLEKLKRINMEAMALEKLKEKEFEIYRKAAEKADERVIEEYVAYSMTIGKS